MIKSAFLTGRGDAMSNVGKYATIEDYIFVAMQNNPMKGKKQRADYIQGVSEYVNVAACRRNRRMNEKVQ